MCRNYENLPAIIAKVLESVSSSYGRVFLIISLKATTTVLCRIVDELDNA
jgi:hypothetical protein